MASKTMQPVDARSESQNNELFAVITAISDPLLEKELHAVIAQWNPSAVISSREDPLIERKSGIWVVDQALFKGIRPEIEAPVILILDNLEDDHSGIPLVFPVAYTDEDSFWDLLQTALHVADRCRLERKVHQLQHSHHAMAQYLGTLRAELSSFYHDMNNPLSITSGNTQLLLEIADADAMDQDLIEALKDVEDANQQIKTYLQRILVLKNEVASYLIEMENR